jgi:cell division protein FtsL
MTKLNVLLVIALLASCLVLIRTAHESRQLFTALDRAEKEKLQLDAEFRRLDAERQTQATHQKIGRVAAQRLKMVNSTRELTTYVDSPAVAMPTTPTTPTTPTSPSTPAAPTTSPHTLPPTTAVVAASGKTRVAP